MTLGDSTNGSGWPDIYDLIDVPTTMRIELDFSAKHVAVGNHRPRAESKSARGLMVSRLKGQMHIVIGKLWPFPKIENNFPEMETRRGKH
jgi:hypothetical protein